MHPVITAVVPVFALIVFGHILRRYNFPETTAWDGMEKLIYWLFLPLLIFKNVKDSPFTSLPGLGTLMLVMLSVYGLVLLSCFLSKWAVSMPGKDFASVTQGALRFNNYIGLSLVLALAGKSGVAYYAAIMALAIPISNAASVLIMAHYASHGPVPWRKTLLIIVRHPLIIATLTGLGLQKLGLQDLGLLDIGIGLLTNVSLPLGLLCVGAAINLNDIKGARYALAASCGIKLVIFPLATAMLAGYAGLSQTATIAAVVFAGLPTATTSHIIARQMGANYQLMAGITGLGTLLSLITLPILLLQLSH